MIGHQVLPYHLEETSTWTILVRSLATWVLRHGGDIYLFHDARIFQLAGDWHFEPAQSLIRQGSFAVPAWGDGLKADFVQQAPPSLCLNTRVEIVAFYYRRITADARKSTRERILSGCYCDVQFLCV